MSAALQRAQALLRGQRNTASATAAARVVGASRPSTQSAGTPSAVAPSSRTEPSARVRKSAGTQGGDTSFSGLGTSELSDEADSDGDDDDAELDDGSDGSDDLQAYLQKLKRKGEPPSAGLGHASTKAKASPRRETDGSSYLKKGVVSSVSPEKRANSHTASSSTTYRKTNGLKSSAGELESDNSEVLVHVRAQKPAIDSPALQRARSVGGRSNLNILSGAKSAGVNRSNRTSRTKDVPKIDSETDSSIGSDLEAYLTKGTAQKSPKNASSDIAKSIQFAEVPVTETNSSTNRTGTLGVPIKDSVEDPLVNLNHEIRKENSNANSYFDERAVHMNPKPHSPALPLVESTKISTLRNVYSFDEILSEAAPPSESIYESFVPEEIEEHIPDQILSVIESENRTDDDRDQYADSLGDISSIKDREPLASVRENRYEVESDEDEPDNESMPLQRSAAAEEQEGVRTVQQKDIKMEAHVETPKPRVNVKPSSPLLQPSVEQIPKSATKSLQVPIPPTSTPAPVDPQSTNRKPHCAHSTSVPAFQQPQHTPPTVQSAPPLYNPIQFHPVLCTPLLALAGTNPAIAGLGAPQFLSDAAAMHHHTFTQPHPTCSGGSISSRPCSQRPLEHRDFVPSAPCSMSHSCGCSQPQRRPSCSSSAGNDHRDCCEKHRSAPCGSRDSHRHHHRRRHHHHHHHGRHCQHHHHGSHSTRHQNPVNRDSSGPSPSGRRHQSEHGCGGSRHASPHHQDLQPDSPDPTERSVLEQADSKTLPAKFRHAATETDPTQLQSAAGCHRCFGIAHSPVTSEAIGGIANGLSEGPRTPGHRVPGTCESQTCETGTRTGNDARANADADGLKSSLHWRHKLSESCLGSQLSQRLATVQPSTQSHLQVLEQLLTLSQRLMTDQLRGPPSFRYTTLADTREVRA